MRKIAGRGARGVAILTVMISLALLMAIVTELSAKETIKYKLAINERDALQAEALAMSGANFAQLILMVQEPLQTYLSAFAKMGLGNLPAYTVWEIMPIDSTLLKGITDGAFFPDFEGLAKKDEEALQKEAKDGEKKKEMITEALISGPYEAPKGGYGGFRGSFSTIIEDEEKKISIRKWASLPFPRRKMIAEQIFRILNSSENARLFENSSIGPSQLIGNIYDYISEDDRSVDVTAGADSWGRQLIGDKRAQYADMADILPKKASMDSLAELRLVPGMTDAIFSVLSRAITIYGEGEGINILSASDPVLASVFYACAKNPETSPFQQLGFSETILTEWNRKKSEGELMMSAEGVIGFLSENGIDVDKEFCAKSIETGSKTFTVKSTATVGTVSKTVLMRLRSAGGIITLYQFQVS